jgi:MFS family permease
MNQSPAVQKPYPSTWYAWYVAVVLYLAYTLAFVDRQIMAFIVGPVRADLHLSDFQFSLLHGLAFVVFYSALGLPIARLADRHSRRNIIVLGVALWSLMTAGCGLARTYLQLFFARLGIGVGEATLSPSAVSLLADYFPPERRALPLSLYSSGVQAGAGIASVGGGLVVSYAMSGHGVSLPLLDALIGPLRPWQFALLLVGLPGLAVSALALSIREPERRVRPGAPGGAAVVALLPYLRENFAVYATLIVGSALSSLATALFRRAVPAAYSKLMAGTMACAVPPALLLMRGDDPWWALGCVSLLVLFLSAPIGLVQAAMRTVTPVSIRAQLTAVYLFVVALIGLALGPSLVAAVTDYVFHDDVEVGASISIVTSLASVASVLVFVLGIPAYRRKADEGVH